MSLARTLAVRAVRLIPAGALPLLARAVARTRPLQLEPGWFFDKSEDDRRLMTNVRRAIWWRFANDQITRPVVVPWYDGLRLRLYLGNDLSKTFFVGGSFEPNEFVFLSTVLQPGMTFVDGGANEGVYTLFAASRVGPDGRVVSFEPSERERERLAANVRVNRLANVSLRPAALGASPGTTSLAVAGYGHEGQNTVGTVVANPHVATIGAVQVPVERLDDAGLGRVDVLKLDVEGSEVAALRGAADILARHRPLLQLEVEPRALAAQGSSVDELLELLASSDYAVYVFDSITGQLRPPDHGEALAGNLIAGPREWIPPALTSRRPAAEHAEKPYISVVATARNDNHGGDLLYRMQVFVNGLASQAARFRVPIELVLVEWNPPEDRPSLADALDWPLDTETFAARIVQVPHELHATLDYSDRLPLFQMIAKNVGIRRARGEFVLATNVDVLLSDELMSSLAERRLQRGAYYRADRTDVDPELDPQAPIMEQLRACAANVVRICRMEGTTDLRNETYYPIYGTMTSLPGPLARWSRLFLFGSALALSVVRRAALKVAARGRRVASGRSSRVFSVAMWRGRSPVRGLRLVVSPERRARLAAAAARVVAGRRRTTAAAAGDRLRPSLRVMFGEFVEQVAARKAALDELWLHEKVRVRVHSNACGDFTLLAHEDWERIRGYAELQMFSMHLDSLLLYEAHYLGLHQVILPGAVYHLEHESGYRPDDTSIQELNTRLDRAAIPQITNDEFMQRILDMYERRAPLALNDANWGFDGVELPEMLRAGRRSEVSA